MFLKLPYPAISILQICIALFFAICSSKLLLADEILLKNGNTIKGIIVEDNEKNIYIELEVGLISIPRENIQSITTWDSKENQQLKEKFKKLSLDSKVQNRKNILPIFDNLNNNKSKKTEHTIQVAPDGNLTLRPKKETVSKCADRRSELLACEKKHDPREKLKSKKKHFSLPLRKDYFFQDGDELIWMRKVYKYVRMRLWNKNIFFPYYRVSYPRTDPEE